MANNIYLLYMVYINSNKAKQLNILTNKFYSKLIILISLGYNTYKKLGKYREQEEGIKLAACNLNIQFNTLKKNGLIKDLGIKQRFNRKTFVLQEGVLFNLFLKHLKQRWKELEYSEVNENITTNEWVKKNDPEALQWYEDKKKEIRELLQVSPEDEKARFYASILKSQSLQFKAFIERTILEYFSEALRLDRFNLLSMSLQHHFDTIVKTFLQAWIMNLNYAQSPVMSNYCVKIDGQNPQAIEVWHFWLLCQALEGFEKTTQASCLLLNIKNYLPKLNA